MTPERFEKLREVLTRRQFDLTVFMDNVHKPHNLAAIARSADAVGIYQMHAVSRQPLRLRMDAASGVGKWVEVISHTTLDAGVAHLRNHGFQLFAAHLSAAALDYRELDYTQPLAIVVGEELHGISEEAVAQCDGCVTIPMSGLVESLNVSVATALLLFEARRQREAARMYDQSSLAPLAFDRLLFEWAHPRVARMLREKGKPYPPLDEEGNISGAKPQAGP